MASKTQLSPTATPGQRYSSFVKEVAFGLINFLAKTKAFDFVAETKTFNFTARTKAFNFIAKIGL